MNPISFGPAAYMPTPAPVDPHAAEPARDAHAPRLVERLRALGRLAWRQAARPPGPDRSAARAGDPRE